MKLRFGSVALLSTILFLGSCADNADQDGDGQVSAKERATEMERDGYLPMKPGRWAMKFTFDEIDVPRLGAKEKAKIKEELASGASGYSCLSKAEAAKPGADFFGGKGAEDCTYRTFDIAGNRARMALTCGMGGMGKADMELDGTVGDSDFLFDTKLVLHVPIAGKIKLIGKTTGKLEGACTGNE